MFRGCKRLQSDDVGSSIRKENKKRAEGRKSYREKKSMKEEYGIGDREGRLEVLLSLGQGSGRVEAGRKNRHRGMQMVASGSICKGRNICAARTVDSIA